MCTELGWFDDCVLIMETSALNHADTLSYMWRSGAHCLCILLSMMCASCMQTSAMVTAEWTMRNMFFGKWGFPFELAAKLYQRLGRSEEARDTARLALKQPWWSISDLSGYVACFKQLLKAFAMAADCTNL
jgi:hypothetical protein